MTNMTRWYGKMVLKTAVVTAVGSEDINMAITGMATLASTDPSADIIVSAFNQKAATATGWIDMTPFVGPCPNTAGIIWEAGAATVSTGGAVLVTWIDVSQS